MDRFGIARIGRVWFFFEENRKESRECLKFENRKVVIPALLFAVLHISFLLFLTVITGFPLIKVSISKTARATVMNLIHNPILFSRESLKNRFSDSSTPEIRESLIWESDCKKASRVPTRCWFQHKFSFFFLQNLAKINSYDRTCASRCR